MHGNYVLTKNNKSKQSYIWASFNYKEKIKTTKGPDILRIKSKNKLYFEQIQAEMC